MLRFPAQVHHTSRVTPHPTILTRSLVWNGTSEAQPQKTAKDLDFPFKTVSSSSEQLVFSLRMKLKYPHYTWHDSCRIREPISMWTCSACCWLWRMAVIAYPSLAGEAVWVLSVKTYGPGTACGGMTWTSQSVLLYQSHTHSSRDRVKCSCPTTNLMGWKHWWQFGL